MLMKNSIQVKFASRTGLIQSYIILQNKVLFRVEQKAEQSSQSKRPKYQSSL